MPRAKLVDLIHRPRLARAWWIEFPPRRLSFWRDVLPKAGYVPRKGVTARPRGHSEYVHDGSQFSAGPGSLHAWEYLRHDVVAFQIGRWRRDAFVRIGWLDTSRHCLHVLPLN